MFSAFATIHVPLLCTLVVMQVGDLILSNTRFHVEVGFPLLAPLIALFNFFGRNPIILGIANLLQILTPLLTIGGYVALRLKKMYEKKPGQSE